jgi:hypothetical protein
MKKLILGTLALALFANASAFAGTANELARVRQLADRKISGTDVRSRVSAYDNKDGNPCAEKGITYLVDVEARKSTYKELPNGEVGQERKWEKFNQYYISRAELLKGHDLSDTLCQE